MVISHGVLETNWRASVNNLLYSVRRRRLARQFCYEIALVYGKQLAGYEAGDSA